MKKKVDIKIFCMDVDGTLTNSITYYSKDGEVMKGFNMRDGCGIRLLKENGIVPIIMTEENSRIVQQRALKLGIRYYLNVKDKAEKLREICKAENVPLENVAYVGDDINDLEVMKTVGLSFAPSDAIEEIKKIAHHVTQRKGGEGAVREVIDFLLQRQTPE